MSDLRNQIKASLIIIASSFQVVILPIIFMGIVRNIPLPSSHYLKILIILSSGIIGFALGSVAFWKITPKLTKK